MPFEIISESIQNDDAYSYCSLGILRGEHEDSHCATTELVVDRTSSRSTAMTGPEEDGGDIEDNCANDSELAGCNSSTGSGPECSEAGNSSSSLDAAAHMAVEMRLNSRRGKSSNRCLDRPPCRFLHLETDTSDSERSKTLYPRGRSYVHL